MFFFKLLLSIVFENPKNTILVFSVRKGDLIIGIEILKNHRKKKEIKNLGCLVIVFENRFLF